MTEPPTALAADFDEVRDITIIGAGPVGLATAFWAGMREANSRIVDSLPEIGGQLTTLYPEKWIFDVVGYPRILAKDLVEQLREQALDQFDVPVHLETTAETTSTSQGPWRFEIRSCGTANEAPATAMAGMSSIAPPTARSCTASPPASGIPSARAAISMAASSRSITIRINGRHAGCCTSSKAAITASRFATADRASIRCNHGTAPFPARCR